jgi:3-oxoacyl-[acyl-carrier protein] reductase
MASPGRPVALVSGGSRGIGRAVVLRLAADGYDVAFCYASQAGAAESLVSQAARHGGRVLARAADVADGGAVRDLVSRVRDELGPIDLAVTSAGVVRDAPLVLMKDEQWSEVLQVDLDGTYNVCRSVVFEMMKRRSGCVINISSVAGVYGNATQTSYSAAKAGVIGLTRALAKEVGQYGIRVSAIAPGFIETDMTAALAPNVRERALGSIPLGRFGHPDEVAEMVSYLATAQYVTGAVLHIDGGIIL